MSINIDKLTKDMAKVVREDNPFSDKTTRLVYSQCPMDHDVEDHNTPYVVVRPSNAEEVSQILKYAKEDKYGYHSQG